MRKSTLMMVIIGCLLCLTTFIMLPTKLGKDAVLSEHKQIANSTYLKKHLMVEHEELATQDMQTPQTSTEAPTGYTADEWIEWINNSNLSAQRKSICVYALTQYKNRVPYSQGLRQLNCDSPAYLDCSALVHNSYWKAQVSILPDTSTAQMIETMVDVDTNKLMPGDFCVYRKVSTGGHTMLYIGTNAEGPVWCHASGNKDGMKLNVRQFADICNNPDYKRVRFGTTESLLDDR